MGRASRKGGTNHEQCGTGRISRIPRWITVEVGPGPWRNVERLYNLHLLRTYYMHSHQVVVPQVHDHGATNRLHRFSVSSRPAYSPCMQRACQCRRPKRGRRICGRSSSSGRLASATRPRGVEHFHRSHADMHAVPSAVTIISHHSGIASIPSIALLDIVRESVVDLSKVEVAVQFSETWRPATSKCLNHELGAVCSDF